MPHFFRFDLFFWLQVNAFVLFPGLEKDLETAAQTSQRLSQTVERKVTKLRELSVTVAKFLRDLNVVDIPRAGHREAVCEP
jgi:hypothetical protein